MFKTGRYIKLIFLMAFLFLIGKNLNGQNTLLLPSIKSEVTRIHFDIDDTGVIVDYKPDLTAEWQQDHFELFYFDANFNVKDHFNIFFKNYFIRGRPGSRFINNKVFSWMGIRDSDFSDFLVSELVWVFDVENEKIEAIKFEPKRKDVRLFPTINDLKVFSIDDDDNSRLEVFDHGLNIQKNFVLNIDTPFSSASSNDGSLVLNSIDGAFDFFGPNGWTEDPTSTFTKFDSNISFQNSVTVEKLNILDVAINNDGYLYASGIYYRMDSNTDFTRDGVLLKLDAELNLVKAIKLTAANFRFRDLTFTFKGKQIIVFYSTLGRFPVITALFDENLNLLDQFGSDFNNPFLESGSEDYFYISSSMGDLGNLVSKISTNESLNECTAAESCLLVEELDLAVTNNFVEVTEVDNFIFESVPLEWERTPYEVLPYDCFDEDPPIPDFNFIDALCQGECATSSDTYNEYAQFREWTWQSPSQDSIFVDSLNVNLCFNEAGTHKLSQTIWVLGCDYTFEKEIVVLEAIEATFENEILCDESPMARLITNRDDIEAQWSDGEQGIEREILESGFYEVTLSDGFCTTIINADLDFVSNNFNTDLLLQLPDDTVLCQQDLPFGFSIPRISDEVYYLQDSRIDPSNVQLSEAGSYLFSAELNGCSYEKAFNFEVDPCLSNIYLPNAFSPNGDGINDEYTAVGLHFKIIKLQVYDRWGELLHAQAEPWDGTFRNNKLQSGVFYFSLEYINTLTGDVEVKKGSFTLVR